MLQTCTIKGLLNRHSHIPRQDSKHCNRHYLMSKTNDWTSDQLELRLRKYPQKRQPMVEWILRPCSFREKVPLRSIYALNPFNYTNEN